MTKPGWYFQLSNVIATAFVCAFLAYSAWMLERGIDLRRDAPNVTLLQMAAYALAAVACWIAALATHGRRKWAWGAFAGANTVAVGHIPFLFVAPAVTIPIITLSVFAFVNALGVTGLVLMLPGRLAYQKPANLLLDAGILAGSCFSIVWAFVGQDIFQRADLTWDRRLLDLSYPFLSIGVLSLILFVIARTPRDVRSSLRYIAAGWLVLAMSMPVYSYLALRGDLRLLLVGPGGVVLFLMLIVIAAARAPTEVTRPLAVDYKPSLMVAVAPYVPFAVAIPVVVVAYVVRRQYDAALILASGAVVALVFVRLSLFLLETQRLGKRLEESGKFKAEMLRFISHELANPLTPLTIEANLLQQGNINPDDPHAKRNVQSFLRSVRRLETLSRDVRELARLDAGKLKVQPRQVDLRPQVEAAIASCAPSAARKEIEIQTHLPESALEGYADPERYGQVLDNLLSNAIKFTPRGGRIKVMLAAKADSVVLGVEDTGAGLSPSQQKQLFTAFSRMHGSLAPGLGLGLVICKAIVDEHGGNIWAESEGPDKGAKFWVSLPRRPPAGAPEMPATAVAAATGTGASTAPA